MEYKDDFIDNNKHHQFNPSTDIDLKRSFYFEPLNEKITDTLDELYHNINNAFNNCNIPYLITSLFQLKNIASEYESGSFSNFELLDIPNILIRISFQDSSDFTEECMKYSISILNSLVEHDRTFKFLQSIAEGEGGYFITRFIETFEHHEYMWDLMPIAINIIAHYEDFALQVFEGIDLTRISDQIEIGTTSQSTLAIRFLAALSQYDGCEHSDEYLIACQRYLSRKLPNINAFDRLTGGLDYEEEVPAGLSLVFLILIRLVTDHDTAVNVKQTISFVDVITDLCIKKAEKPTRKVALRFLNIFLSFAEDISLFVDVPSLASMIESDDADMSTLAAETLASGLSGSQCVIELALGSGVIQRLIKIYPKAPFSLKRHLLRAICECILGAGSEEIIHLCTPEMMTVLSDGLKVANTETSALILKAVLAFPSDLEDERGRNVKFQAMRVGWRWDIPDDLWEDEELGELVEQFDNDPLISDVYENDFETDSDD